MVKLQGWLLDVYPNYDYNYMTSWLKPDKNDGYCRVGAEQLSEPFEPKFYVHGTIPRLRGLIKKLKKYPEIKHLELTKHRLDIKDTRLYDVLGVTMRDYKELKPCAAMIDREGKYAEFQLFNVDLRLSQKYMLRRKMFPLAHVEVGKKLEILEDDQFSLDYFVPDLMGVDLDIKVNKHGKIVTYDDPVGEVTIGDITLDDTDEPKLLLGLVKEIARLDPDIIYTSGGDSFVIPYLYHRAELAGVNEDFRLGRERDKVYSDYIPHTEGEKRTPKHRGKSYFTYGQIRYKPPFYAFKGRIHLDRLSSFVYLESGLYGLIELSRLSGIPLQTMSRLSPGSAISSMQVSQAMADGVLVRWKKNVPESFKDAKTLLLADRGGHIFDPLVGVHENVLEIDFASLYPNIISTKNISPETVLCDCCVDDPLAPRVPATDYHVCRRTRGLIPRVIERIISRRVMHKKRRQEENDMHDQRQKVLKWVLVTCLDGDTIVPFEREGSVRFQTISKIIDKYLPTGEGIKEVNNEFRVFGLTKELRPTKVPVKKVFKFRAPEKILRFRFRQGRELWITKDHPCYLLEDSQLKVRRADELKEGDYIPIVTRLKQKQENDSYFDLTSAMVKGLPYDELPSWRAFGKDLSHYIAKSYYSIRAAALKEYTEKSIWNWRKNGYLPLQFLSYLQLGYGCSPIESIGRGRRGGGEIQRIPARIEVDFDLGFLLGYFIGDGNAKKNMVRFAINSEDKDVLEILRRIILEKFNLPTAVRKESHANMIVLQVNSVALKRVLEVGFGIPKSAKDGKLNIPSIVLNGESNVKFGFLSGLVASDGCVSKKRNFVNIVTYDYTFAKKIGLLLSMLGLEYRLVIGKKFYEIQLRNLCQLEIFFINGWLKAKHSNRLEKKLEASLPPREPQIPIVNSGLLQLSRKARVTREPRVTRKELISRKDAMVKLHQLFDRQLVFNNEESEYLKQLKLLLQSGLIFSEVTSIEEVSPRTPFVYCFEVDQGLPGFVVEGNVFTHNCFGYTGYRNARFGRIECHESITAYGREILLDAMEVVENSGYHVLHGIVDSLWVTAGENGKNGAAPLRESFQELCDDIARRTGISIDFEGYYPWIVFLPNKSTGVGALNRYYGLLDTGKFKARGIELRQRSTPKLFIEFQQAILDTLASAKTKQDLNKVVKHKTLGVIKKYAQRLLRGECDPHDLIFSMRVTRALGEYKVFNDRVAAFSQLVGEGVTVHPGETVRYIILNHDSRDPARRVRVLELMEGDEQYDKQEYLKHLLRYADSILRPFGYTEENLKEEIAKSVQVTFD